MTKFESFIAGYCVCGLIWCVTEHSTLGIVLNLATIAYYVGKLMKRVEQ